MTVAAQDPPAAPPAPPARRRRGWIVALVVVGAVLLLGVVAFLVADGFAKGYARDLVRERVLAVLGLPSDAVVDVDLGGGSIILQALAGRLDDVDVAVPEATFGELSGSIRFHAEGVPLAETEPVDVLRVGFEVAEEDLGAIAGNLSGLALDRIELDEGEIVVGSQVAVLGIPFQLGMTLAPSAADGQLVFTPTSVSIGDSTFAAEELLADPLLGAFAGPLLSQQSICIAAGLPQALVLTSAEVDGDSLVLGLTGDGAALGGPELQTPGVCAAA